MRLIAFLIGCLLTISSGIAAPGDPSVDDLLAKLNNPDPQVREAVGKEIESLGVSARPALIKASQSHDNRISGRAVEMLMKLPFFREDDPATIKDVLSDYHSRSTEERRQLLVSLAQVSNSGLYLLRVFQEDPDDQIAWTIADFYAGQKDDFWKPLLGADLTDARPAVLATAARGLFFVDRPRALQLLKRAITSEEKYPSAPADQLRQMYQLLAADALAKGDLQLAQQNQRKLATLPAPGALVEIENELVLRESSPLFSLLTFYAGTGPIAGFGDDLVQYRDELLGAENLFALSQVMNRPGFSAVSAALRHLGMFSMGNELSEQFRIGNLLSQQQWVQPTRDVLGGVLKQFQAQVNSQDELRVHTRLYMLARELGDDAECIRQTEAEVKIYERENVGSAVNELHARIEAHRLHQARLAKDRKQIEKSTAFLGSLTELDAIDADVGIDWINGLKEIGENEEATRVFNAFYQRHVQVIADNDGSALALNNIAWLCAGVKMKTDFALDAARRAVRAEPTNYGHIDTFAEAHFARGEFDRAIELENFALALRPGDQFLLKQRAKFEAAKPK